MVCLGLYVGFSDWFLSLRNMHLSFLHAFHGLIVHFFLVLSNIPLFTLSEFMHCSVLGFPGKQNQYIHGGERETETERLRDHMELDHVVMETDKSQDLQSVSWRPMRTNGVVPAQIRV